MLTLKKGLLDLIEGRKRLMVCLEVMKLKKKWYKSKERREIKVMYDFLFTKFQKFE